MLPDRERPAVLVVDDDDATCTLIQAVLRHEFNVDVATDSFDALDRLRARRYAAILLDLKMPGLDGFGILEGLASEDSEALERVIVVTAAITDREMGRVRGYRVANVVKKPFEIEALRDAVHECARRPGESTSLFCASPAVILLLADLLSRSPLR